MNNDFAARKKAQGVSGKGRLSSLSDLVLDAEDGMELEDHEKVLLLDPSCFYAEKQVRTNFDEEFIANLAATMKDGQIMAITVHPKDDRGYKIVDGECRWRAAQLIPGFKLKAVVDPKAAEKKNFELKAKQLIANIQRNPLGHLENAVAIQEMMEEGGLTQSDAARMLGFFIKGTDKPATNTISRILSVLKLPEEGRALIEDAIIEDLQTLELLRKISEINAEKFSLLCRIARAEGALQRSRAENELRLLSTQAQHKNQVKKPSPGAIQPKETEKKESPQQSEPQVPPIEPNANDVIKSEVSPNKEPVTHQVSNIRPKITVKWNGKTGVIVWEKAEKGCVKIQMSYNDSIEVSMDEITIIALDF